MLTADQFNWMYQDYKRADGFVYAIDYEKINGREYVTAVTKRVGRLVIYMSDDYEAEQIASVYDNCKYTSHASTFGAIYELMTTRARKTKRTRKSFDATEEWLKKLPLDEKVEL